ncbi:MAG TPA: hypothetical protein EYH34_04280 [Planctomycetes bacterium]|nr:hypothetical protein [Planctomycetota bacterium]
MRQQSRGWVSVAFLAWLAVGTCPCWAASTWPRISRDELQGGFADPPPTARPAGYWAWLNGYVDADRFGWELSEWKEKGLSKAFIFECGARDRQGIVPVGPAFMSDESVGAFARAIREAEKAGIELGFTTSSSWNAGGSWVKPEHAAMGLFKSEVNVEGPGRFSQVLPFPKTPAKAPRGPDGMPAFWQDVAVLAVPEPKVVPGYEFIFQLAPPGPHRIERVVLYNTESDKAGRSGPTHLFVKDFAVAVSVTSSDAASFREVLRASLKPTTRPQGFRFPPVEARYVRLTLLSGHNPKFERLELGEFEAYTADGKNVALEYRPDGSGGGATLLRYTSAAAARGNWSAANIHDGRRAGPAGSWRSGPPAAFIEDPDAIVDLTDRVEPDGRLTWAIPPGRWTIMRFVCTNTGQGLAIPSPKSQGLAIDHFSAEATRMHFEFLIGKLEEAVGPLKETPLTTMYLCSYELRGAVWTPRFLDEFRRRRGYDMKRYLPVLFGAKVASQEATERFEYDYRKTQGDLLVDAFYRTAAQVCHEHGLLLCAEAGGPGPPTHNVPVDALKAQGVIDIPRGEFWTDLHLWVVKETACASHIYGKRVVDMEAFTGWQHWQHGPFDLKPFADRAMCEGTNHFTFHTCPHNPRDAGLPGWAYHAGTHMGPTIAWWPLASGFIDYLSRCSFLLQQGLFVADVCYYYGDQAFNFVPPKHVDPSLGPGYDYDVTNAEVILTRMDVRDGRIVLPDGMSYELLVLPERDDVDLDVLLKLEELIRKGATVVGRRPVRSNGLADHRRRDGQVKQLADKIWGPCDGRTVKEHRYGQGRVIWGRSLREVLRSRGVGPDFTFQGQDDQTDLDCIHRRCGGTDIYFVWNRKARTEKVRCTFRVEGKEPELWMPDTGRIVRLAVYRRVPNGTEVPLVLPPLGSAFVVFGQPADGDHVVKVEGRRDSFAAGPGADPEICFDQHGRLELASRSVGSWALKTATGRAIRVGIKEPGPVREVEGPWEVRFPAGWGAPPVARFPRLVSWSDRPEKGIRYFSGLATYRTQFELPLEGAGKRCRWVLDLGRVEKVAQVSMNGCQLGILWKPPFQVDVTGAIRPGRNQLEIQVANTWSNRLVGDALAPESERFCRTNITHSTMWRVKWKDTPLAESGLLGPVRLIPMVVARMRLNDL